MNKKGFTLTELLAAVIIVAMLSVITGSTVTHFLKQGKKDLYNNQLKNIELAAKSWVTDNKEMIYEYQDGVTLTLSFLQSEGYIDDNIKNPSNNEPLDSEQYFVNVVPSGKTFTYEVSDDESKKLNTVLGGSYE